MNTHIHTYTHTQTYTHTHTHTHTHSQEKRKTNMCCCINHSCTAHAATTAVQGVNGIELSEGLSLISDDGTAHGPPPSHCQANGPVYIR